MTTHHTLTTTDAQIIDDGARAVWKCSQKVGIRLAEITIRADGRCWASARTHGRAAFNVAGEVEIVYPGDSLIDLASMFGEGSEPILKAAKAMVEIIRIVGGDATLVVNDDGLADLRVEGLAGRVGGVQTSRLERTAEGSAFLAGLLAAAFPAV